MSGYTRINMMAIDPSPVAREHGIDARFGRSHLDSDHLGVSYFRYPPDFRTTMGHRHSEQEEVYVVVAGSGRIRVDDDIVEVGRWDVVRVAPTTIRGVAAGPEGLEMIAVGSDRPAGGDGETVDDWWQDSDT
jgi:mannose-6-phosphate isomerase-like protein (cupin superfamily)